MTSILEGTIHPDKDFVITADGRMHIYNREVNMDLNDYYEELGVQGCLEGFCKITGKRSGQHTNGGCNCLRELPPSKRRNVEEAFSALRGRIEYLQSKLDKIENTEN